MLMATQPSPASSVWPNWRHLKSGMFRAAVSTAADCIADSIAGNTHFAIDLLRGPGARIFQEEKPVERNEGQNS